MPASSSSEGFFQTPPAVANQFLDDEALQHALRLFIPPEVLDALRTALTSFGALVVSPEVLAHVADAERNHPYLVSHTTFGVRQDKLVTSAGWRTLQELGQAHGIVAIAYEREHGRCSRLFQFAKYHLWTGSSVFVTCPSAMTDGAAKLLLGHVNENPEFAEAVERLTSRDAKTAWTSGQWMTERAGGSDVSLTETVATWDPAGANSDHGPWAISGFKWFSSATDADMAVLLAQTPKGLSAFYAPMYLDRAAGKLNGVRIQRLKNKMGSKPLPTAELELSNMRAHLVGEEGRGIKEIAMILNITRVHTAVTAVGFWGRGLSIARAFAKVRTVKKGTRLVDMAAHVATLAEQIVKYRAWTITTFFVVALLGREECPGDKQSHHAGGLLPDDPEQTALLLRLLTPVIKAQASKAAIHSLQECMEAMGGIGYLENDDPAYNIARLYRDCNVLSIWEGTTNIMAEDVLRIVKGKQQVPMMAALGTWIAGALEPVSRHDGLKLLASKTIDAFGDWRATVHARDFDTLRAEGREVMQKLGDIVCAVLLLVDATAPNSSDTSAEYVARLWLSKTDVWKGSPVSRDWKEKFSTERRLVLGSTSTDAETSPKASL